MWFVFVGRRQDLGLVDVVDAERLEDLGLDEMTDARLGHDRDRDRGHDPFDHRGVAHARDAAGRADVGRDALERHDGHGPGILGDLGVLGRDDVHDDAALEHLGEALLGGPGGGLDGHVCVGSLVIGRVPWRDQPRGHARTGRAVARARHPSIAEGPAGTRRWTMPAVGDGAGLAALAAEIAGCRACPRLVAWREAAAADPPARFRGQAYWARPVPGFGDPAARILLLGLAPAKDGGNRTGRVFTGDRSGDFLFAALHRAGLASQPASTGRDDNLVLHGAYVAAAVRCAPPDNRPLPDERDRCAPYLHRELALLAELRVIVALGAFAWDAALTAFAARGALARAAGGATRGAPPRNAAGGRAAGGGSGNAAGGAAGGNAAGNAVGGAARPPRPRFGHGAEAQVGRYVLLGSYHPSQQNVFTRRLTAPMVDAVLGRAVAIAMDRQAARRNHPPYP